MINFPPLIDSRGRIPRAPRGPQRDGEFCGVGLSPGVVSGRARTLRSPHDGPLVRGEILIAYTTDPGWTPIFANAAAVVLEIGGALQHGAVVAREFGLPCVAGIVGISSAIKDGQMLEVDGAAGMVRLLAPVSLPEPE
jgi:pyruvate,water dikinase